MNTQQRLEPLTRGVKGGRCYTLWDATHCVGGCEAYVGLEAAVRGSGCGDRSVGRVDPAGGLYLLVGWGGYAYAVVGGAGGASGEAAGS